MYVKNVPTTTTLLILGASGDLATRLLLPGIGSLLSRDHTRKLRIIGADRAELTREEFSRRLRTALTAGGAGTNAVDAQLTASAYHQLDVTDPKALAAMLEGLDSSGPVLYFALPPAVTEAACRALTADMLPPGTHLAMEKPFGRDLPSAAALNAVVGTLVPEERIHRVDHFLGKSTVLNVMALRFANRMFQALWDADAVERVEISYDESLALEGRAGYYDHAGALVDMIQSHLLQVMAVVMMEPPSTLSGQDVRDAKSAVLRATRLWGGDRAGSSRRARYTAGSVGGSEVPSYVDEPGVDPSRGTETMAQVTVEVRNQRWAGVPITLRSGKALGHTRKRIQITFRDVRHLPEGFTGGETQDTLIIGLDPDVMELRITTNGTADPLELEQSVFRTHLRRAEIDAYGEVLAAILDGDTMLSVRGDAAEECWRITDEVLAAWKRGAPPMEEYPAGSGVPAGWTL